MFLTHFCTPQPDARVTTSSPSERFRGQPDELFGSGRELEQILEEVARLGVALLFQVALEAEVSAFLGRELYVHGERAHADLVRWIEEAVVARPAVACWFQAESQSALFSDLGRPMVGLAAQPE